MQPHYNLQGNGRKVLLERMSSKKRYIIELISILKQILVAFRKDDKLFWRTMLCDCISINNTAFCLPERKSAGSF